MTKINANNSIITICDFVEEDMSAQDKYLSEASDEFLINTGIEPSTVRNLPPISRVRPILAIPVKDRSTHVYSIKLNNVLIGMFFIAKIQFGKSAELHLHIFDQVHRKHGYTSIAFWKMLDQVFNTFKIDTLICQPASSNTAPNKFLQKKGLKIIKTFLAPAEGLLREHEANRYEITREFYDEYSKKSSHS